MTRFRANGRRRLLTIAAVAAVIAVAAIATSYYLERTGEPRQWAVVEQDVLYRSGQPYRAQIDHLIESVGLRTVVIAREDLSRRVPDEIEYARGKGLNVVHLPLKSRTEIPDEQVEAFFLCVDDPANHPILVHCSAGRHRTGYLSALYRIERQGWSVDAAVEEMLSFDPEMRRKPRPELLQLKRYVPTRDRVGQTPGGTNTAKAGSSS